MSNLLKHLEILENEKLNLILIKNGKVIYSTSRDGMMPLLEAIETIDRAQLLGSIVVDKIVGKAAALLICLFQANEVNAKIMSLKAVKILEKYSVKYSSEIIIPEILNKFGTDICPFEKAVSNIENPEEACRTLSKAFYKNKINPC